MVEKTHTSGLWPALYEPFRNFGAQIAEWLAPASEASTNDKAYLISVELPGVADKDIDVSVDNGVVTVKGEKRTEKEDKGETWYFSERQYGAFQRSFRLPQDADEGGIKADLKDGVLTITVPKKGPEAEKATKVRINAG
ncbi:Hsp20/alpha crystallin family protein [Psychromarinibacter sp. C21-152]|uniref:Hsp20/alpha crystallin family protein n=1 Tax=Psychromarinibacter sediminicola TaxID=3033385 RepID=A0AAE3NW30_9RHOB|nr:Hsp20/alpha crystallin family protein [Psychromarinibacter sediminicola]MDF0603192.1 Hsp20/alpha crystallin family protein [Psychromarinibacter sediminicola]